MLVRLLYASRATSPIRPDALATILRHATRNNALLGVTGLLCHMDDVYLQVLEGGREAVSALYNRIARDERHTAVTLMTYDEIDGRLFVGWAMGEVDMKRLNPSLVLRYSEKASLDPYAMSGEVALSLLTGLVETGSVACLG